MLLVNLLANINCTLLKFITEAMAVFKSPLKVNFNWIDITDDFKNAAESKFLDFSISLLISYLSVYLFELELNLGELVHEQMFGLYEAMAAIELMDPKMDAGMIGNKKKIYKFEEMVEKKLIKIDGFTNEELIGIIDDTYSSMVTWLGGHSLAQTLFINVFLHNPMIICDKTLQTFCIVILKISDMIINFIVTAKIYEEEDFQIKNYGFDLCTNVNISKIIPKIKLIEDEIRAKMEKYPKDNKNEHRNLYEALLVRIKFTKHFFLCFYTFKKYLNVQNSISSKELILQLTENLNHCEKLFHDWIKTIDYGIKPDDNSLTENNIQNYPTIIGFEPLINQRLLAPSFPRYSKLKPRLESVSYLKEFLERIKKMLKLKENENFIDIIRFFNYYSIQKSSCVVSRSLLLLFYMPKPNLIFGETEFLKIIKDSCKHFILPPSLSGKITLDSNIKEIVDTFFQRCLLFFQNIVNIYGHNRASQRGKLAHLLTDLSIITEECSTIEQYLNNSSFCDYLHVWIIFYKYYLMSQYLLSGFELELYNVHEYGYIFFELEHIWEYMTRIVRHASQIYIDHEVFLSSFVKKIFNV